MSNKYHTQTLEHLANVAGVCEQIDLIGQIDASLPKTGRKVNVGSSGASHALSDLGLVGMFQYKQIDSVIARIPVGIRTTGPIGKCFVSTLRYCIKHRNP